MITMKIDGAKEIEKMLDRLGTKVGKKVVKSALKTAAKAPLQQAKSNAKALASGKSKKGISKLIAKFLKARMMSKMRKGNFGVAVEVSAKGNDYFVGYTSEGKRYYIPAAIEYGHDNVAPRSFMRNAWDVTKSKAFAIATNHMRKGIERVAKI